MVEIEGERVLAASCVRKPAPGMKVQTASERAKFSRKMVFELLVGDQPERAAAHDPDSRLWRWADKLGVEDGRFPRHAPPAPDRSHPAMAVQLDACIQCNLCVRACREVQVNDVIGMAGRGYRERIVFDFDDPMGISTCVACGECVQACPTGALMPATMVDANGVHTNAPDREAHSVCPYCGVGCQLTYKIRDDRIVAVDGRNGPANHNRLCVKGRFGFDYAHHPDRLTEPLIRKDGVSKRLIPTLISAMRHGKRRSISPPGVSGAFATATAAARSPGSALPKARTRRPISSRSSSAPGSAATMSTIARACAMPPRWRP
jgi:formate dehydrogenase major subunit